jgi:alcohol dehydrogenase
LVLVGLGAFNYQQRQSEMLGSLEQQRQAVLERAGLKVGDSIAVFALGPLGLCVTKAARAMGAGLIIGVDPGAKRRETALAMGANQVLDPGEEDPVPQIIKMSGGAGVDISVEAVGRPETLKAAFMTAKIGGAVSSLGVYGLTTQELSIPMGHGSFNPDTFYHRRFITTLCPSGRYRMERRMDMIKHADLDFSPLWTHSLELTEALEGYRMVKNPQGDSIKIGLRPAG